MEDQAHYEVVNPALDRRELVAPVAAWLVGLGFQHVVCGPTEQEDGLAMAEVLAGWESPAGQLFHLLLVATTGQARCRFFEQLGERSRVLCEWVEVQQLQEVQFVVTRSRCFQRARLAATEADSG